jgi:hypothetical protein
MRIIKASISGACGAAEIETQQAHTATGAITTRRGCPCSRIFTPVSTGPIRNRPDIGRRGHAYRE